MTVEPRPPHDPLDEGFYGDVIRDLGDPIFENWFRPALFGAERLPAEGPVVLAANHSGNNFPYDAMVLDTLLWHAERGEQRAKVRTVYEKELALTWWMRPFGLDNFWRRGGGVDLTFDNFDTLLARGSRVLYFPEGVPGIGKGFNHRYELQRFSTSFVILAARHAAPVVPVYIVNAEWCIPFGYTWDPVDRLLQRMAGVPFLTLPWGILAILWPWLWFLSLPAKMVFVLGEPLDVRAMTAQEGITALDRSSRDGLNRVAARVRQHMQRELEALVQLHGRKPYRGGELWASLRAAGRDLWKVLPTGWPIAFGRFDRDRRRPPARNRIHAWLRDWDLLLWYVPVLGWPLLSLARRWRRPPCGYRGLSREERKEREGSYVWRLEERPLP